MILTGTLFDVPQSGILVTHHGKFVSLGIGILDKKTGITDNGVSLIGRENHRGGITVNDSQLTAVTGRICVCNRR